MSKERAPMKVVILDTGFGRPSAHKAYGLVESLFPVPDENSVYPDGH